MGAVPTLDTFTPGEIVTAAKLNSNIRDALNFALNPPVCHARSTTPFNTTHGGWNPIILNEAVIDTDGMFSSASNTILTVNTPGVYEVVVNYSLNAASGGRRAVRIIQNGASAGWSILIPGGGVNGTSVAVTGMIRCAAGDTIQGQVYQDLGTTVPTINNVDNYTGLTAKWIAR